LNINTYAIHVEKILDWRQMLSLLIRYWLETVLMKERQFMQIEVHEFVENNIIGGNKMGTKNINDADTSTSSLNITVSNEVISGEPLITRRHILQGVGSAVASAAASGSATLAAAATKAEYLPKVTDGMTVGQYVMARLKKLGVRHTFGVPGDFIYDICDAIEDDPDIQGIWCANELNAGYAAEGNARVTNGFGVGVFTMAAELSALQSMGNANADSAPVLHLVGRPSLDEIASGGRLHHMIEGMQGEKFNLFSDMTAPLTAGGKAVALITPENCVEEMERVIALMQYHSKPGVLAFPRLVAQTPVIMPKGEIDTPLANPTSDPGALDAAAREIVNLISNAKRPVWLPGYAVRRFDCVAEAQALIEASGLPFYTAMQDQAVLSETHPQFHGNYFGHWTGMADPAVTEFIEGSDCIVGIGPENHSFNNAFHTVKDTLNDTVNIMPRETRIGFSVYRNVNMKDLLVELAKLIEKRTTDVPAPKQSNLISTTIEGTASDAITYEPFYQRLQKFYKPNDVAYTCTSLTPLMFFGRTAKPEGLSLEASTAFGMLGWGTAAILGAAAGAGDRRCVILTGEGAHMMTANELGAFARYGLKPIFIVNNNSGYGAERVTNRYPNELYNDVAKWDFADLPGVMGCKDWFTAKVTTLGELDAALATASDADTGVYIEVIIDQDEMEIGADWLFGATGAYFGMAGRSWEQWLDEGRAIKKG
jgi:indolepyruvate decarboxylase